MPIFKSLSRNAGLLQVPAELLDLIAHLLLPTTAMEMVLVNIQCAHTVIANTHV